MELDARFASKEELEGYLESGYREEKTNLGSLVFPGKVRTADLVTLDLSHYLWSTIINFKGIRL